MNSSFSGRILHGASALVLLLPFAGTSFAQQLQVGQRALDVLTFEGIEPGSVLDVTFGRFGNGPVAVTGSNPDLAGGTNAALVFDSGAPTGGDFDLGTPHEDFGGPGLGAGGAQGSPNANAARQRNLLVVAQDLVDADGDGLVDQPGDSGSSGASLEFDFSVLGGVQPESIGVLDIEPRQTMPRVLLLAEDGSLLDEVALPVVGDNGFAQVDLGETTDVFRVIVELGGSGAVDNFVFAPKTEGEVAGVVWRDLDGDGFRELGEPGLEGVRLDLSIPALAGSGLSAVTGPDGGYLFEEVPAGDYLLEVATDTLPMGIQPTACNSAPGDDFDSECSPLALGVTPGTTRSADFGYTFVTDFVIGDFCFVDFNSNGIQDVEDFGLEGVVLTLFDEGGTLLAAEETGPDGQYLFNNLQPGTYTIVPNTANANTGNFGPAICNFGADGSIDSDCGPVCVVLVQTLTTGQVITNITIDFGYAFCGDCEGGVNALSLQLPADAPEPLFVEVLDEQGAPVFTGMVEPEQVFSFFGTGIQSTFGSALTFLANGQEVAELDTSCGLPIFLGLPVGPFEIVAGASALGGAFCSNIEVDTLDFDGLAAGTRLDQAIARNGSGPIGVRGINPQLDPNAALVFGSAAPTGGDFDLGAPNQDFGGPGIGVGGEMGSSFANQDLRGGVLIVAENLLDADGDGLVDVPDDAALDGTAVEFDFSEIGGVSLISLGLLDIEERPAPARIRMFAEDGSLLSDQVLPVTGDNGFTQVPLGDIEGVFRAEVQLGGSGALDDLVFAPVVPGSAQGIVWDDQNQNGLRDLGEPGLADVLVELTPTGSSAPTMTVTTGILGEYSFLDLVPGDYRIEVVAGSLPPGFAPTLCNSQPGDAFDSECSPLDVSLTPRQTFFAAFGFSD